MCQNTQQLQLLDYQISETPPRKLGRNTGFSRSGVVQKTVKDRACTVADDVTTCKVPTNGVAEED